MWTWSTILRVASSASVIFENLRISLPTLLVLHHGMGFQIMNVGLVHFQFFICTCPGPNGFHDFDFSKIKNIISAGTREELLVLNMNGNVLRRLDYVDLSGGPAQFDCFLITPQNEVNLRIPDIHGAKFQ